VRSCCDQLKNVATERTGRERAEAEAGRAAESLGREQAVAASERRARIVAERKTAQRADAERQASIHRR
jgi:hypothetical protein